MSDEEKQAIKDCDSIFICLNDCMSEDSANDYRKSYKILKNLIEKQSKEIEELKNGQIDFWISDKEIEKRIRNKFVSKEEIIKEFLTTITSEILQRIKEWGN